MAVFALFALSWCIALASNADEIYFQENRRIAKIIVEALQDRKFDEELMFDMKKENQGLVNRTMSLLIKYIVKREVDNYRSRRTDAISRRIYSSLIMKLIDIAKDLPRNSTSQERIDRAHRYYMTVESRDMHDEMADIQVFHAFARLYDVMFTMPKIMFQLGNVDDLTPRNLVKKLKEIDIKPVHLGIAILVQYHLRDTINFVVSSKALEVLSTKPQMVGAEVIEMLKALAARMLPIAELIDIHISHSSPAFKDTCPSSWLNIMPKIMFQLGNVDDLTPRNLVKKLKEIDIKPVHLGIAILVQYHLRDTINFVVSSKALEVLSTKPQMVGAEVIEMLKALAARMLPIAELIDIHISHSSPAFKDTCPSSWLNIMPKIMFQLGNVDDLTPRNLVKKLKEIDIKPVHLGIAILVQYHLRDTINFVVSSKALEVLSTKPQMVGAEVIEMLKALAARMLPIAELIDIHISHSSPAFKDTCPSSWLNIMPKIMFQLGNVDDLTPRNLVKKLKEIDIKPVHLGIAILVQYHLRDTINFVVSSKALEVLSTKPQMVGAEVIEMLKALAARMLPIAELIDIHISHSSPAFKDTCPSSWLNIMPKIMFQLGNVDDLTPRNLVKKLKEIDIKPVHLGIAILVQYHLRDTINFVVSSKALEVLSTKPQMVGAEVIEMLKALAARMLPIAELIDIHISHSSPAFKDTCPSSWLNIVNNKH